MIFFVRLAFYIGPPEMPAARGTALCRPNKNAIALKNHVIVILFKQIRASMITLCNQCMQ